MGLNGANAIELERLEQSIARTDAEIARQQAKNDRRRERVAQLRAQEVKGGT